MSLTYLGAIVQALVVPGLFTNEEAQILTDGVLALVSLGSLVVTLYGRFRLGDISLFGTRK